MKVVDGFLMLCCRLEEHLPTMRWGRFRFWQVVLLALVFLLGFGIRIYDLKDPPLDFHASRQLRSAIIARGIYYRLNTQAEPAIRQAAQELAKLEVYEPPILETIVGFTDYLLGGEYFWLGRIYNALFWCVGGLAIFLLGNSYVSFPALLAGLSFYFFLPFSVVASRSFQPDPWMVMWILLFALALYRWSVTPSWKWAVLAGMFGGIAMLVKVMAGFFVATILLCVIFSMLHFHNLFRTVMPWVTAVLAALPSVLYYLLSHTQRSADFFSFWVVSLSGLVLNSNFYADWLAMLKGLMGLTTVLVALVGVLLTETRARWLLIGGWAGYVLHGLVLPYQFITHEYYHLPLVALVALSMLAVLEVIFSALSRQGWLWRLLAVLTFVFAGFYGLYVSRSILYAANYALEPASWQRVGQAIPEEASFVALTADYGLRLNYYGWRSTSAFWPSSADLKLFSLSGNDPMSYEKYFKEVTAGRRFFLVTAFSELDAQPELKQILDRYPLYAEGNGFLIYDLTQAKP
ncbi:MAG: glycosyltransferase family 39 protein [Anaerolineales bacterium]